MKLVSNLGNVYGASKIQPHKVPNLEGKNWWSRDMSILNRTIAVYTNNRSCYFYYDGTMWYVPNGAFITASEITFAPEGTKLPGNTYRNRDEAFNKLDYDRGGIKDRMDCTVWSIKVLMDISYSEAHALLKSHGRKNGHGMPLITFLRNQKGELMGHQLTELASSKYHRKTVQQVVNENWPGKYFMFIRGHVFAMVDGKIYDARFFNRSRVTCMFKVD